MRKKLIISSTVRLGKSAGCCDCTPMRSLMARMSLETSMPSSLTVPLSAVRSPSMISTVVVFPAPFGPSMPNTSPLATLMLIPSTALMLP